MAEDPIKTVKVVNDDEKKKVPKSKTTKYKLAVRRGTMMPPKKTTPSSVTTTSTKSNLDKLFRWWQKESIKYAFSHPYVRSRLERLMGSNVVSLTDREYMQRLQQRILEDYESEMNKRIAAREFQERERVKFLVLSGIIPLAEAPPEMANHPVILIDLYCQKLIAIRRAKIKRTRLYVPKHLYWDDTPDPPSGLSIEKGHIFRGPEERLCHHPDNFLVATTEEDIENGYMFAEDDFMKLYYENPQVKQLQECTTVEEMYQLADQIIESLATFEEQTKVIPIAEEPTEGATPGEESGAAENPTPA